MSGREQDSIGAFLPSIDRNLIRDLDRHLRNAATPSETTKPRTERPEAPGPVAPPQMSGGRPSTTDILEAVGQAAASMAAMNARIQELEVKQAELMATNTQLRAKLSEVLQSQQGFDSRLRGETERAERAEEIAARHLSRCQVLEGDLSAALGDLTRIAEAIHGTLSTSPQRRR